MNARVLPSRRETAPIWKRHVADTPHYRRCANTHVQIEIGNCDCDWARPWCYLHMYLQLPHHCKSYDPLAISRQTDSHRGTTTWGEYPPAALDTAQRAPAIRKIRGVHNTAHIAHERGRASFCQTAGLSAARGQNVRVHTAGQCQCQCQCQCSCHRLRSGRRRLSPSGAHWLTERAAPENWGKRSI